MVSRARATLVSANLKPHRLKPDCVLALHTIYPLVVFKILHTASPLNSNRRSSERACSRLVVLNYLLVFGLNLLFHV